jgi:hypothetical protein
MQGCASLSISSVAGFCRCGGAGGADGAAICTPGNGFSDGGSGGNGGGPTSPPDGDPDQDGDLNGSKGPRNNDGSNNNNRKACKDYLNNCVGKKRSLVCFVAVQCNSDQPLSKSEKNVLAWWHLTHIFAQAATLRLPCVLQNANGKRHSLRKFWSG